MAESTPQYDLVIGLEVHVQLQTKTKLFCGCANLFNPDNPNVQTCPVCLGLPGALPVMNRDAFRKAVKVGLALHCNIPPSTKWDRKQYYYPDLPKAYQISQYDFPVSEDGWLEIVVDVETSKMRRIGIIRAHLEEDAGKNVHDESGRGLDSRVDLNRCGTPLVEIVSEPDLRSAQEAKTYLEELKLLLTYLDVSDCNMQEGSLRCDANVNLHVSTPDGHRIATPIVEVKNLNSFRGVEQAIEYEATRQFELWKQTGHTIDDVAKETRGWDADRGLTFAQRGKEEASDYRYFPDPDLIPASASEAEVEQIRGEMYEFPADRRRRYETGYQLSHYDAGVIIDQGRVFADYFEAIADSCGDGKKAANWVTQDVQRELHERHISIDEFPLRPAILGALLKKVVDQKITVKSAREVFTDLLAESDSGQIPSADRVDAIISAKGLEITSDTGALDGAIAAVLAKNAKIVEDVRGGKLAAVGPLIGQVMKEVKGADPKQVREMVIKKITG